MCVSCISYLSIYLSILSIYLSIYDTNTIHGAVLQRAFDYLTSSTASRPRTGR